MPYSISLSDSSKATITVNDLTENNISTSLSLVGRNYSNYGVAVASNFVHLLENFASANSPNNAIEGQLWFDSSTKRLMLNDSTSGTSNWRPASGTHIKAGPIGPTNALLGDLWVDTETQQLSLYNGQNWILVGPSALAGKKTGSYVEQLADAETGALHYVNVDYVNDDVIKITSTETFIPQKKILGFDIINPGINITAQKYIGPLDSTTANTVAKIYGTATSADALNVTSPSIARVIADNFARRDVANLFLGSQTIINDGGITLGTTNNFSLTVNQSTGIISNNADGSSIDVRITNAGSSNLLMKFDGKNRRVGINHPTPNVELDVNGSAYISGHLIAKGELDSTNVTTGSFQVAGGAGIAKNLYVGKNINAGGHIVVGEVDALGTTIAGVAIAPRANLIYDIGTSTNRFKKVYAETFDGAFTGTFSGNLTGSFSGQAIGLTQAIQLSLNNAESEVTSTVVSLQNGGTQLTLATALNQKAITNRAEVLDNRVDDTLLIYRNNVGLRRVTRDSFLLGEAFTPIGAIMSYAGIAPPNGYLFCDGSLISRQEFPLLYQVIGSTYGSGTNPVYFRLPDLRGRFALGNTSMRNSLNSVVVSRTSIVLGSATPSITITLDSTDGISIGMSMSGNGTIPAGTVVQAIPNASQITVSQLCTIADNTSLTFTYSVLSNTVNNNGKTYRCATNHTSSASANGFTIDLADKQPVKWELISDTAELITPIWSKNTAYTIGTVVRYSYYDRIAAEPGNLSPSTLGGASGTSHYMLDSTDGTNDANFSTGSAQTFGTTFDVPLANPYLTINYIIRAGVATTQI